MLEGHVRFEEGDEGRMGVNTERVVAEVYGGEVREVEDGGEEEGQGFGDLGEQAAGEDVGEIGIL